MGAQEADTRRAWRVAVAMLAAGAVTMLATLPAPDPDTSDRPMFVVMAGIFALLAVLLWSIGPRRWTTEASVVVGLLAMGALVAIARPLGATPLFYLWPVLHAAYFLPRRRFVAAEVLLAVSYGVALAEFSPPGLRMTYWMGGVIVTAVAGGVVSYQREQLERAMGELRASAGTDPLTGLMNRRDFGAAFARELARVERTHRPLTLAIVDIDHFKSVNDRFGHLEGDEVLRQVAGVLAAHMRDGDVVARLGGEEFALLLADTELSVGHEIAERIGREVADQTASSGVALTVSTGLAERAPGIETEADLMRAADVALYEAKAAGRRRVASHDGEMTVTGAG